MNSKTPLALTLPLQGTHLIEASAGTGKTYTIAALYVRLILGHGIERKTPKDILVVTFTDAATEELRDRIRKRLSESAQYFRNLPVDKVDDFLINLRNAFKPEQWNLCAKYLEVAANYMDEAAVFTIHSWCNRMLQQHAFDSGSPFKQDVNTDDAELLNNVIRDYWRVHFYGLEKSQCEFIVKNVASSPDDFSGKIQGLLKETEALKLDNFQIQFADIFEKNEIKVAWKTHQQEIETLLQTAINKKWLSSDKSKKAFPKVDSLNWLKDINDWLDDKKECNIDSLEKFTISRFKKHLNPTHQDKYDEFSKYPIFSLIENQNSVKQIKLHAIKWIRHRYAEEKKKLSRVTFDDMLSNLDNALQREKSSLNSEESSLGKVIRKQYPVALIDEFQDTDPIQYRIFNAIYKDQADSSCFLIGDPKQAIYSFRGADIYTYLKAKEDPNQKHHTLKTNFRSTKAFVDAVNQLFIQAENNDKGAFRFGNAANNPLPFVEVGAKGKEQNWYINNKIAPALTFWTWEEDKISMPSFRERMAEVTASKIVELLLDQIAGFKSETADFRKLELKDIAILVRNRNEAKIIRQALNRRNLKSVYLSEQDSIYDTDEAPDVLIWLNAMANPRDEKKVRAAVSTGTLNFDKDDLYALTLDDDQWVIHLDRFQKYQIRWQKSGILPALRSLIHDYCLHLSLNDANESERKITNVLHLAELLQQHSSKIEGEEALIHHLAELVESKDSRAGNNSIIRLESDANLIKIVTIHKSKGLEYPLVFLPFVSDARVVESKNSHYYKYHDDSGLHIDLDKKADNQVRSDEERLQEDLRLLYVAVTRAQYACWLGIASIKPLEKSAIGHLIGGSIANLEKVKKEGGYDFIEIIKLPDSTDASFIEKTEKDSTGSVKKSAVKTQENWWTASYSSLSFDYKTQRTEITEIETAQDDAQREDEEIESSSESLENLDVFALPKGAKPGVAIHSLFEKSGDYGFKKACDDEKWQEDTIKYLFADNLWDDEKRKVIKNVLPTWLKIPLVENARFIDLQPSHYKSELEFLIGANSVDVETVDSLINKHIFPNQLRPELKNNQVNGFLKGFIDLVFCHENKYYILDYKFNHLGSSTEDYNESKIKEVMLKHRYDLQYSLYLLALHRLLKIRLGDSYNYDTHIGGAIYVFLRGNTKISNKPPRELIESLDKLFGAE
jgi:exodeoxyribonuclease V beta subunit